MARKGAKKAAQRGPKRAGRPEKPQSSHAEGRRPAKRRPSSGQRSRPKPPWLRAALADMKRIAPQLPQIDPGDLLQILTCIHRPFNTGRRFFIRRTKDGRYVL